MIFYDFFFFFACVRIYIFLNFAIDSRGFSWFGVMLSFDKLR